MTQTSESSKHRSWPNKNVQSEEYGALAQALPKI